MGRSLLRNLRHVWVYIVVYAVLLCFMHPMDRRTLCESWKYFQVYSTAQNFASIHFNVVKAGILVAIWPFAAVMSAKVFVETGCFSMSCFALACRARSNGAIEASCKLFWRRIFEESGVPVPKLIAVCDETSNCTVVRNDLNSGMRKPLRSMYGIGVVPCSLDEFLKIPTRNSLLEEVMVNPLSYRVCTLRTLRGTRVRAMFVMKLKGDTRIPSRVWNDLLEFGRRLAKIHESRLQFAPLVGWDVMHDASNGFVALEGNLGGSLGFHAIPRSSDLGRVDPAIANAWVHEVREADRAQFYDS